MFFDAFFEFFFCGIGPAGGLRRRNPSLVIGYLRSDFRCFPLPLSPCTYFLCALVIDHCVSSRQRLSAVFGGGNCHTPQVFDSNLELDFCFLGFGLRQDHLGHMVLPFCVSLMFTV